MLNHQARRMKLERDSFSKMCSQLVNQKQNSLFQWPLSESWDLVSSFDANNHRIDISKSSNNIKWYFSIKNDDGFIYFFNHPAKIYLEQSIDYLNIDNMDDSQLILSNGRDPFLLSSIPSYVLIELIKSLET